MKRRFQLVEAFQFAARGHRVSVGADLHFVTLDSAIRNKFAGIYLFPSLRHFLRGEPDLFIQAIGDPQTQMRTLPLAFWIQDRWSLTRSLTVELGLRYDHQVIPSALPPSSDNFSPRIGVAWRPIAGRPLVIRAGGGLFYDRYPLAFLNDAVQKDGTHGFEHYATGADAVAIFRNSAAGTFDQTMAKTWYVGLSRIA